MAKLYGRLAIIAILVYAGVSLWYGRVEERLQGKNPIVKNEAAHPSMQKPAEPESAKMDYHIILTRNIFKAALELGEQPSGKPPMTDVEDLAETKMQLVLLGTVTGSKDDARAIIRNEKTKNEDIYHVGSELQGVIINRIGRGKVVLQVNGREEVLNLKETEPGRGPQQAASPVANDISQRVMQTDGSRTRPAPAVVPQRRISFRNPAPVVSEPVTPEPVPPEPVAPEPVVTVPGDSGVPSPTGEQEQQSDSQLVPNDETTPPGGGADQQSQ